MMAPTGNVVEDEAELGPSVVVTGTVVVTGLCATTGGLASESDDTTPYNTGLDENRAL